MPLSSTSALVLSAAVINEQDKVIHLLSTDKGMIKAIAPGAVKNRNRFGSLLELFTEGEFFYYWNEEKEMVTLSRGEIRKSHFEMISRPENIFYFSLVSEILLKMILPHDHEPRLYKLLQALLQSRERDVAPPLLLLYFLVWILRLEGLLFNPGACSSCHGGGLDQAWLRRDYHGLLCRQCHSNESDMIEKTELEYIRWTQRHPPEDSGDWTEHLPAAHLIRILTRKIEYHGEFSLTCSRYLPEFR